MRRTSSSPEKYRATCTRAPSSSCTRRRTCTAISPVRSSPWRKGRNTTARSAGARVRASRATPKNAVLSRLTHTVLRAIGADGARVRAVAFGFLQVAEQRIEVDDARHAQPELALDLLHRRERALAALLPIER